MCFQRTALLRIQLTTRRNSDDTPRNAPPPLPYPHPRHPDISRAKDRTPTTFAIPDRTTAKSVEKHYTTTDSKSPIGFVRTKMAPPQIPTRCTIVPNNAQVCPTRRRAEGGPLPPASRRPPSHIMGWMTSTLVRPLLLFTLAGVAAAQQINSDLFKDLHWRNIGPFRGGRKIGRAHV